MSVNPFVGLGTVVEFASVASPSTYTTLAGAKSAAFSGDKRAMEKTTTFSTTSGTDTYIGSTLEPGMCDVKCDVYPADTSQEALKAIYVAGSTVNFQVVLPNSNGMRSFLGLVESFTPTIPSPEKSAQYDIKIKLSGPWTDTF